MPATIQVPAFQEITAQVVDQNGNFTPSAQRYFDREQTALVGIAQIINTSIGVNSFALASAPALGPSDAGFVGYVTDFCHLVQWTGAAWIFLDGGGGYFSDFPVAPQGLGWQACDGSATSFLTVGAVLGSTGFVTPDFVTNPTYRKSGAYTGAIDAAMAPGAVMSGSTAPDVTGTGTTGDESAHTHDFSSGLFHFSNGGLDLYAQGGATTTTGPGTAHHHTVPALTIPALGAGTLAATVDATGQPQRLSVPVFFRR